MKLYNLTSVAYFNFTYVILDTGRAVPYNKYYCVPYNLSAIFTGRSDVIQKLREGLIPSETESWPAEQKRFILHGPGGSGKTQACLKFAQDYRER
jgi:hypothetical protein